MKQMSYCDVGASYKLPDGILRPSREQKEYLAGAFNFSVQEIEVYEVTIGLPRHMPDPNKQKINDYLIDI